MGFSQGCYFLITITLLTFTLGNGLPTNGNGNPVRVPENDNVEYKNILNPDPKVEKISGGNFRKPRQDDGDGDGGGDAFAAIRPFFEGAAEGFLGVANNLVQSIQQLGQPVTEPPKTTAKPAATNSSALVSNVTVTVTAALTVATTPVPPVQFSRSTSNVNVSLPQQQQQQQVQIVTAAPLPPQIIETTTVGNDDDDDDDDEDVYADRKD